MPGKPQFCNSLLHIILCVATVVLVIAITVLPAWAQNPVPPTALEAAASPAFAQRLAHPGTARSAPPARRRALPQGTVLYENGPLNGTYDAWTINEGYIVSNSFTVGANTITGFDFYTWAYPGDKPLTVDWSITSVINGGTVYGSGTATLADTVISTNGYGYQIDYDTVTGLNISLGAGTYYLNLQNAVTSGGNPLYWDENDGAGCKSPGCPSQAAESGIGTIGSESFDITGSSTNSCGGTGTFNVIYNFTGGADGSLPNAATMDRAGNIYGTNAGFCQNCKTGIAFKLAKLASGWVLSPLYDFGNNEFARLIGPDGSLYGTTSDEGIDGCGGNGCGTVFNLKPPPTAPATVFAPWWKTTLYEFTGGTDAANPNGDLVFDRAGNLYGSTPNGGAYGLGAVYKLTPSNGGWTESVLYSFSGGSDGQSPSAVVVDAAGNLYGTTETGGTIGCGTVFQLSPSGMGWTKNLLHSFMGGQYDGCRPLAGLTIDGAGNLYGATSNGGNGWVAFLLTASNDGWEYTILYDEIGNVYNGPIDRLALDAAGNVYGSTPHGCANGRSGQKPESCDLPLVYQGHVFKLSSGTWAYTLLHNFCGSDGLSPINLMLDGQGNLFGTASGGKGACDWGYSGCGVVWEISP